MQASPSLQPTPELTPIDDVFSAFAKAHLDELKKAGVDGNTIKFHECCFTFSTKKPRKRLGHPDQDAPTIRRWLEQHDVENVEDFASLLRKLSTARTDGKAGELPTWNAPHPPEAGLGKRQELSADAEPAAEEDQLAEQPLPQQPTLQDLLQENQRLRHQLELERAAAVKHEHQYLGEVYFSDLLSKLVRHMSPTFNQQASRERGLSLAAEFQAVYPELPSFGSIPRPNSTGLPAPAPPADPGLESLKQHFLDCLPDLRVRRGAN